MSVFTYAKPSLLPLRTAYNHHGNKKEKQNKTKRGTMLPKPTLCYLAVILATSPSSIFADILELRAELPECSLLCIAKGAEAFGCRTTDLDCQCTQLEAMSAEVAPCLVNEGRCELDELTDTVEIVGEMCLEHFRTSNLSTTSSSNPGHFTDGNDGSSHVNGSSAAAAMSSKLLAATLIAVAATLL